MSYAAVTQDDATPVPAISFVCFLWNTGFRNYRPEHVNMLANAVHRFHPEPHRFICVADSDEGFADNVEVILTPRAAKKLTQYTAPQGNDFPSCYRRLWCFSDAATVLGERIMLLDIDCMITGNLRPLISVDGDFVGWRPMSIWGKEGRIGGGTWMLKTGRLSWLWNDFIRDPEGMIRETRELGWNGSDQAIISRLLAKKYPIWPQMCGIYGVADGVFYWDLPPKDAVIVHFNSDQKPWTQDKLWMKAYCNYFKTGGRYEREIRGIPETGRDMVVDAADIGGIRDSGDDDRGRVGL